MERGLYRPFTTSTEIRLVGLLPDTEDSQVRADLLYTDLASSNPLIYEAISYNWGPSTNDQTVLVGDLPIKVRHNLWSFLKRLRSTSGQPRPVWCDAPCISQHDLKEKSEQVRMIGDIFMKAKRVLVWVGVHVDGSVRLFQNRRRSRGRLQKKSQRIDRVVTLEQWSAFLSRPFWSRAWIIQEIVLAKSVMVFCGCDRLDWDDFLPSWAKIWGALLYVNKNVVRHEFERMASKLREVSVARTMYRAERLLHRFDFYIFPSLGESILGVSRKFSNTNCLDPRDNVFAFLSLERQPSILRRCLVKISLMKDITEIYPDYEMDPVDLFIQLGCSRLIRGHVPTQAARYLAALFRNLQLDHSDAQKLTDLLLDALDDRNVSRTVIKTVAYALDECGSFG